MTINVYSNGLRIGSCFDVAIVNNNAELMKPTDIFGAKSISVSRYGGSLGVDDRCDNESVVRINENYFRITAADSYCRGYGIDNIWWAIKTLIVALKHRGLITWADKHNDKTAAGALCLSTSSKEDVYRVNSAMKEFFISLKDDKKLEYTTKCFDATAGVLALCLDKRPNSMEHFTTHNPSTDKYIFRDKYRLTYAYPSNFWVFSPSLAHLIYGAIRVGMAMAINKDKWPTSYGPDEARIILLESDRVRAREFIQNTNKMLSTCKGIASGNNPYCYDFWKKFDFIEKYGIGCLGPDIYDNWHMKRKRDNYVGHLGDVPGWETTFGKLFAGKKNGDYGQIWRAFNHNYEESEIQKNG